VPSCLRMRGEEAGLFARGTHLAFRSDGSIVRWENAVSMGGLASGGRCVTEKGEALPIDSELRETSACKGGGVLGAGTRDNG